MSDKRPRAGITLHLNNAIDQVHVDSLNTWLSLKRLRGQAILHKDRKKITIVSWENDLLELEKIHELLEAELFQENR